METPPRRSPPWSELAALLAPLAIAALGYARSLDGEFQFDDLSVITESPAVRDFWRWLGGAPLLDTFLSGRPLTTLTFAANYDLGRLSPTGYHAVNLLLHLGTVLLVGALTRRVAVLAGAARPGRLALGVAGLFAVHPLQSQAVAYVTQRAEVLGSAFYAATLLLLLARPLGARPRPWGTWAAALATFLLGFAAKPIVVTLPAALLLLLVATGAGGAAGPNQEPGRAGAGRDRWRAGWPLVAAFSLAAAALGAALLGALRGQPHAGFSTSGTTPWLYLLTQARAILVYLRLLAWPSGQSVEWAFPSSPGLADPATLAAALAVLALLAAAAALLVRGRRTAGPEGAAARLAGLGLAWFFVLLAPTSSFVPLADTLVEHRVYLASWGIFLAVVAGADALAARRGVLPVAAGAWAVAVAVLGLALFERNAAWQTREALWRNALEKAPRSPRVRHNLGAAFEAQGRLEEAIGEYRAAAALAEGDRRQRGMALLNLGAAQLNLGRLDEARATLLAGLQEIPDHELILVNLALLAGMTGELGEAEALAERIRRLNPSQPSAHVIFGNLALERGDWAGALGHFARALDLDRERGEAHHGRAIALRALGRHAEECAALREALASVLRPGYQGAVAAQLAERCR